MRFSLWHDQLKLGYAHCLVFSGECLVFVLAHEVLERDCRRDFIASAFLMQQCVSKFNRDVKWEVFFQFRKKSWKKRGVEDFLSSIRSRISPNTCTIYWDTFLLNFHSRGQQVEDHVSLWENLLWDTPSKGFERVWLYVQVPASASCTSLPGWNPSWVFSSKAMLYLRGSRQRT